MRRATKANVMLSTPPDTAAAAGEQSSNTASSFSNNKLNLLSDLTIYLLRHQTAHLNVAFADVDAHQYWQYYRYLPLPLCHQAFPQFSL